MFFEQRVHSFESLAKVVGAPRLPAFGFIFEHAIVEPLSFNFGLNGKLLQLYEGSDIVAGKEENDWRPQLVHKIHERSLIVRERVGHRRRTDQVSCPAIRARCRGDGIDNTVEANGRFEPGFITNERSSCEKT